MSGQRAWAIFTLSQEAGGAREETRGSSSLASTSLWTWEAAALGWSPGFVTLVTLLT